MMACPNVDELLGFVERHMDDTDGGGGAGAHVAACGACREAVDGMVATQRNVNAWLGALAPREEARVDVLAALGRLEARVSQPRWFERFVPAAALNPARYLSVAIHVGAVALLMFGFTSQTVQRSVRRNMSLIDPAMHPYVPERPKLDTRQGGGGGGARETLPVSKGQLPKSAMRQFVPPQIVDHVPRLAMDASILAPPDTPLPQSNLSNFGDPLARLVNGSNGNGSGGGMGNGATGGLGPGNGGGFGPGEAGGIGGGVYRVGGGVSAPSVLSKVDPEYSEEARKAKYSGTVYLTVIVDSAGHARDVRVTRSLGMGLDEKAVEAVLKWRFRPGMKGGQAVSVRAQIEVNFRLL